MHIFLHIWDVAILMQDMHVRFRMIRAVGIWDQQPPGKNHYKFRMFCFI